MKTRPECFARDWRRTPKTPEKCRPCPWEMPCAMWVCTPKRKLMAIILREVLDRRIARVLVKEYRS